MISARGIVRRLLIGCAVIALLPTTPVASGPIDLSCSIYPEAVPISPDGSMACTITLIGCGTGPFQDAFVELAFSAEANDLIAWAPGQTNPFFSGYTDAAGEVTFYIAGGGCIDPDRFSPQTYIVQLRINGVVFDELAVNSPDAVNTMGSLPTTLGTDICENGATSVGLSDAVFHTGPVKNGAIEPCTRFTGPLNTPVTLADAVVITPYIKNGVVGACQ